MCGVLADVDVMLHVSVLACVSDFAAEAPLSLLELFPLAQALLHEHACAEVLARFKLIIIISFIPT